MVSRNTFVLLFAVIATTYQLYLHRIIQVFGFFRKVENVGTRDCWSVDELKACEKIVLHEPSGILYLACSNFANRQHYFALYNGKTPPPRQTESESDYLAILDTTKPNPKPIRLTGFDFSSTLAVHGMDVVPSLINPDNLYIYLVNHRSPSPAQTQLDPKRSIGDSVIEIFETRVGSAVLKHLKTVRDESIISPNDVVGSSDGKRFWFANDRDTRVGQGGVIGQLKSIFTETSSVGYCDTSKSKDPCKILVDKLPSSNGITKSKDDKTFYVASTLHGRLTVLQAQKSDGSELSVVEQVPLPYAMDNLSVDKEGVVWAAAFPKLVKMFQHMQNPTNVHSPTTAVKFTHTSDRKVKVKVEKAWEDDGGLVSGASTVIRDVSRKRLLFSSVTNSRVTVCNLSSDT